MRKLLLTLAACAAASYGSSPRAWEMHSYSDFIGGKFNGVSLARDGRLALAPRAETLFASDQPIIWSVAQTPDGTLYAHASTTCLVFDMHHKPPGGATE